MDAEECRSEASFGVEESNGSSLSNGDSNSTTVRTTEGCSPSDGKKRKRISPKPSPKVSDGFGDSEAGELLTKIPELAEVFSIVSKVGEGTFSNVYLAKMLEFPDELWALKHIIPTSAPERIENELKCLQDIGGRDNVIGVETTLRCRDHVVFTMPYFPHQKFQDYMLEMSVCEIRDYMKNLFTALSRVHSFQVIHRDVKPSNFLYSREHGRYSLVDFGLAMKVPGSSNSLLDTPVEPHSKKARTSKSPTPTPKNGKTPRRRSTRLSPTPTGTENKGKAEVAAMRAPDSEFVLKPSCINSDNWKFARHVKEFKLPKKNVQFKNKKPAGDGKVQQDPVPKRARLLCPLRHVSSEICSICMARAHQNTPRAGTPGFRSPEVLLKHPDQTPAVDVWSAGTILLCILTGRYPFFRAYDDLTALAQIITVRGSNGASDAAGQLGKDLVLSTESRAANLKLMCHHLRRGESKSRPISCSTKNISARQSPRRKSPKSSTREKLKSKSEPSVASTDNSSDKNSVRHKACFYCEQRKNRRSAASRSSAESATCTTDAARFHVDGCACPCTDGACCWVVSDDAYDLLRRCLELDPGKRISAAEALKHPFFEC